jgi:hypothetical protein
MSRRSSSRSASHIALVLGAIAVAGVPLSLRIAHADPPARTESSRAPSATETGRSSSPPPSSDEGAIECNEQRADPALIRRNYIPIGGAPDEVRRRREAHAAAIRLRTERYGRFEAFGDASLNAHTPSYYTEIATFMGLPVRMNRRVIPALHCVEHDIETRCASTPYRPHRLEGLRTANSFRGGEISNHVYGIAIDIDPQRNPCCGCGTMFANNPHCRAHTSNVYERMEMPRCWIDSFERFGFYWLGNDRQLRDLMHFEFLADPDRIVRR